MGRRQDYPGVEERRTADGLIRYRVRVRRNGSWQTATLADLEEALAWKVQAVAAAQGRRDAPAKPSRPKPTAPSAPVRAVTVEDAARRLCRGMVEGVVRARDGRPYKPSVCRKYEEALRCLVLPRVGAVPIAALTMGDCQRLVDEIAAERKPEHARKALTAFRVALRVAQRYGELEQNPCSGVRVPVDAEGEKPARILSPEECERIIEAAYADDERLGRSLAGPLVVLLVGTGLRLGEALALRWGPGGLDVDQATVRVEATLDRVRGRDGEYALLAPKSRTSRRTVQLPPEDVARLRRHRLATGRPADGELVFAGDDGKPLSPVPAYRAFKRACLVPVVEPAKARLEQAKASGNLAAIAEARQALAAARKTPAPRPHDCRHAYATALLGAGLTLHAVAALLGHKDATLVAKRYGHALPDELATAGDTLSAWRRSRLAMDHGRDHAADAAAKPLQTRG